MSTPSCDQTFEQASTYMSNTPMKLSNDVKLQLYALYKQSTVGPCNTSKPGLLEMTARAKWNAWNDLKQLDNNIAKQQYIELVDKLVPTWRETIQQSGNNTNTDTNVPPPRKPKNDPDNYDDLDLENEDDDGNDYDDDDSDGGMFTATSRMMDTEPEV